MRIVGEEPLSERLLTFRKRGQIELARVSRTGVSDDSKAAKTPKANVLPIDIRGLGTAAFAWLTPRQVVRLTERIQPSSYLMVAELVTDPNNFHSLGILPGHMDTPAIVTRQALRITII